MTDQKHTKEPWVHHAGFVKRKKHSIDHLFGVVGSVTTLAEDHANSKRIVACVNALAGIDDPEAFMRDMKLWRKLQEHFKEGDPSFSSVAASLELDEAILEHLKGGAE